MTHHGYWTITSHGHTTRHPARPARSDLDPDRPRHRPAAVPTAPHHQVTITGGLSYMIDAAPLEVTCPTCHQGKPLRLHWIPGDSSTGAATCPADHTWTNDMIHEAVRHLDRAHTMNGTP